MLDIYIDADGCPVKEEVYRVVALAHPQLRLRERIGGTKSHFRLKARLVKFGG